MIKKVVAKMDMESFRQLREAENERDFWRSLAEGMADCLDSSTEATRLLEIYNKKVGNEQGV